MDASLESLGRGEKESSLSQKVLRLFRVLKEEKVCIPSDYECSVCWIARPIISINHMLQENQSGNSMDSTSW